MHDGQNKTSLTGLVMRPVVAPWYFARQNSKHCIQRHHLWRIYRKKNPCCTHKQELAAETQEGGPKSGLLRPHQRRLYLRAAAARQRRMMSNFDESTNFGLDQDKESIYTRRPSNQEATVLYGATSLPPPPLPAMARTVPNLAFFGKSRLS